MLTQDQLKGLLDYDPATGMFCWLRKFAPTVAGYRGTKGHRFITVMGKKYYAHRLAWLYVYGEWSKNLDHINQKRDDNRILNLREATKSQNAANGKVRNSVLQIPGVHRTENGNYKTKITFQGKAEYLGTFPTLIQAALIYNARHQTLFGEFSPNGA